MAEVGVGELRGGSAYAGGVVVEGSEGGFSASGLDAGVHLVCEDGEGVDGGVEARYVEDPFGEGGGEEVGGELGEDSGEAVEGCGGGGGGSEGKEPASEGFEGEGFVVVVQDVEGVEERGREALCGELDHLPVERGGVLGGDHGELGLELVAAISGGGGAWGE